MPESGPAPDPRLVSHLRRARRALVFTGAGVSTASGIADFRGPQGVWTRRKPVYYQDFLASEEARVEYWEYKLEGEESFRRARPNAAHEAVAALERAGRLLACVTQNIDGLHERAGTSPGKLVELHGTNAQVECTRCGARSDPAPHYAAFRASRRCPSCAACGGWLKLATISFGQSLVPEVLARAFAAAEACDLAVALGSTLGVHPAASVPLAAARRGVPYVVVNRGPTDQDGLPLVTLRLEGDVTEVFPPAVRAALEGA
jgi:NAD-dependent deacetylase